MKKQLLKTIVALTILVVSFTTAHSQNFFTYISDAAAGLSSDQSAKLARMRTNHFYESIQMVQVANFATFQQDGTVTINLPGYDPLKAYANTIRVSPETGLTGGFQWEGAFAADTVIDGDTIRQADGNLSLFYKNGEIYGGIRPPGSWDNFELVSFAPGKNALIKYNTVEVDKVVECGRGPNDVDGEPVERTTGAPCNTKARVLIVYTQGTEDAIPSVPNAINRAMGELNGTINNCTNGGGNSKCYFELAGTYKLGPNDFQQPANSPSWIVRDMIASNPVVRQKQDYYAADMIVYLSYGAFSDGTWGVANIYQVANPVAVVASEYANANYTFAHEVGHVMGGRHQQTWVWNTGREDNTPDEPHGYHFRRKGIGTAFSKKDYADIMHEKIQYFDRSHVYSTPDIYIWSHPIGIAGTNDVTKVVFENVCAVSEIRPDTAIWFTVEVSAPNLVNIGQTVNCHATPHNGQAPYTYQWWWSTDGITMHSINSTIDNASFVMPNSHHAFVYCYCFDFYGRRADDGYKVVIGKDYQNYDPYSGQDAHLRTMRPDSKTAVKLVVAPNPAADVVGVGVNMSTEEAALQHTLTITDAVGKVVYSSTVAHDTFVGFQVDVANFAAGTYFVKLSGGTVVKTEKLIITK
jgi:hypothetical protein